MAQRVFATSAVAVVGVLMLAAPTPGQEQRPDAPKPKRIEIAVTAEGFSPGRIEVEAGIAIELVFMRKTDKTCATEVVVPSL